LDLGLFLATIPIIHEDIFMPLAACLYPMTGAASHFLSGYIGVVQTSNDSVRLVHQGSWFDMPPFKGVLVIRQGRKFFKKAIY